MLSNVEVSRREWEEGRAAIHRHRAQTNGIARLIGSDTGSDPWVEAVRHEQVASVGPGHDDPDVRGLTHGIAINHRLAESVRLIIRLRGPDAARHRAP